MPTGSAAAIRTDGNRRGAPLPRNVAGGVYLGAGSLHNVGRLNTDGMVVQVALVCLCGCGQPLMSRRFFRPGHDARLRSVIRRVEKGEIPPSAIPNVARPYMSECTCCGTPIMDHESGMGPVCRAGRCTHVS